MSSATRIEDLRRRVERDPASIAFAQLGEECRRAGLLEEAIDVSRAGLRQHPGYLSARVTLARALFQLERLAEARTEFEEVLKAAPENLAALRGLGELRQREGQPPAARPVAVAPPAPAPAPARVPAAAAATPAAQPTKAPSTPLPVPPEHRVLAELENLLAAIHVSRADRHA